MARVKLTKTELKAQNDALKRYLRFLPMLQLKKRQLQAEIARISAKEAEVAAREAAETGAISRWIALAGVEPAALDGLVESFRARTSSANIAGVAIPVFEGADVALRRIDKWATPAWLDDVAAATSAILALRAERAVCAEQLRLVSGELRQTSQRVNLFEKVKIPECREAIRTIKIALGDEQTAAVTRGKIAKSRTPESGAAA